MDMLCWLETPWCLEEIQLGDRIYTRDEAMSILQRDIAGPECPDNRNNGLVALGHQLIAAKLNIECLDSDDSCVHQTILDADAIINGYVIPPVGNDCLPMNAVSNLVIILREYNNGNLCVPTCPR
jgi:hypothetical protein